ncbi:hypothetical protein HanXRQr2_Chr12g0555861 [Helianthus annuus]|uniref:Uncharacterized protein n=1 Tax=Helianthus annuus TaxID=4232 RepID=A0A9K3HIX8_HELAN|nr:hypothetical protein HanXRQr2_Chr12g0555861 [Helianthus annuus]KAJ0863882.1 hypothetical protein HanPSC8_Chr12g0535161 [Helianthus annuus]
MSSPEKSRSVRLKLVGVITPRRMIVSRSIFWIFFHLYSCDN